MQGGVGEGYPARRWCASNELRASCRGIVREPTGEAEHGIGVESVSTWRWTMRRGVRQKQASDLQLVLDGDVFEKRKKTIEVELQHGMPRPGPGSKRLKRNQQPCRHEFLPRFSSAWTTPSKCKIHCETHDLSAEIDRLLMRYWAFSGGA
jgi:hypothetical protein